VSVALRPRKTLADAVAAEAETEVRHELVDGELFAMAGGTLEHNDISANILGMLYAQLRGRPCRPVGSDQRVHIVDEDAGLYPDVAIYCGPRRRSPTERTARVDPTVLFEVLSDSSEGYDRGRKFELYRSIPTLEHYVLVAQDRRRIEVFDRNDDGTWTLRIYGAGQTAPLPGVEVELVVDEVYEDVFDPPA